MARRVCQLGVLVAVSMGHAVSCAKSRPTERTVDGGENPTSCVPVTTEELRDVLYVERGDPVSDEKTRLDVYPPASSTCGRPLVVWVHGGAWSLGDKTNQLDDKLTFVHSLGAILVSVNYRLTDQSNGVTHPDHVEDVAAAIAFVREHAEEFGGDRDRIAVLGHSAGAHLVALAGTNPRFLAAHELVPSDVACIGSYDTTYSATDIVARNEAYEAVFTSDPDVWVDASPSSHVGPGLPPFQLACRGDADRVEQCEAFAAALVAAGNEATVIDASSLTHEQVNRTIGVPGDDVMTPPVREFLERCWD
ncbi:MAG: carboxylesterase family protein [Myxococcota bacterium]